MQLTESHEQTADFRLRTRFALGIIVLLAGVILSRLWVLQMRDHENLAERADRNRTATEFVTGVRGLIYDRSGAVLADNVASWQLEIFPEKTADIPATLAAIGEVVPLQPHELQRFEDRRKAAHSFDAIPLKLGLSEPELARLEVNLRRWPGARVRATLARRYPFAEATAHLVGYVGGLTARDLEADEAGAYRGATHIGKTGIERSFEETLRPVPGWRRMESNASGRRVAQLDYQPPEAGADLRLTIDASLQQAAVKALEDRRGAVVAMDPRNGDVLALVSQPSFDPHLFINGISHKNYRTLIDDPKNPLFNRAVQGRYPPGSTVKPVMAMAGLEFNTIKPHDHVYCGGYFQLPNKPRKYRDWKRRGHGTVNLRESIAQSCDVYYYELGNELGIDRIADFAGRMGIGARTHIRLPAEDAGILPTRDWKRGALGEVWYPGETLNISIGQGYMVMTPLQLAQMTARIAMRGKGFRPRLVKTVTRAGSPVENAPEALATIKVRSASMWDETHKAMTAVINSRTGTARHVAAGLPFAVAGKTGTAQVAGLSQEDDKAPQLEDVPEKLRDHALFIAFAPAEDPQMAIAVVVENSGGGGAVAAPVAHKLLKNWLMRCDGMDWRPWCLEADI